MLILIKKKASLIKLYPQQRVLHAWFNFRLFKRSECRKQTKKTIKLCEVYMFNLCLMKRVYEQRQVNERCSCVVLNCNPPIFMKVVNLWSCTHVHCLPRRQNDSHHLSYYGYSFTLCTCYTSSSSNVMYNKSKMQYPNKTLFFSFLCIQSW